MKKLSLAAKIGLGFGIVILLLVVVSLFSWRGLSGVSDGFMSYRGTAKENNLAASLQANMLMARLNVISFFKSGSDKDAQKTAENINKVHALLDEARKEVHNPERAGKIEFLEEEIKEYESAFGRIKELYTEYDEIMKDVLVVYGSSITKDLDELMVSAEKNDNAELAFHSGETIEHFLLGRLFVVKFQNSSASTDADQVESEFVGVFKNLDEMDIILHDPTHRALSEKIEKESKIYLDAFVNYSKLIYERDNVIVGTLQRIGPEMAAAVEFIKNSVNEEQEALGQAVRSKTQGSIRLTLIISLIAVVVGIVFSFILTRTITGPIQKVVDFVDKVAKGDFTSTLAIDQQDEVGKMSAALSNTVSELGSMIKDIITGVNTLSSSSTELAAISTQLSSTSASASERANSVASASEEMSVNMSSVSAAMEQSASNVGMVATAAEEMSATVREIAESASKAKTISEKAVGQSQESARKVTELGTAADKIGKVTEVITEISEQTNLLALNATIEAARAGEAGKGFAVVANEIKELAKQTAEATVDIKVQIEGMQGTTSSTISDIKTISEVINEINDVITSIASAVEQQSAATSEISENVAQAAGGIDEVNENVAQSSVAIQDVNRDITEISNGSTEINSSSQNVNQSANDLSKLAEQLNGLVRRFKVA